MQSNPIYKLQYTVYKTRKASVERKFLFVPNLLWGTAVNLFSEILSVTVRQGSGEAVAPQSDEDRPRIVTFSDRISKPQNQLHCVTWDRDLWNAIDCETDRRDDFDFSDDGEDNLIVSINCTCQSGKFYTLGLAWPSFMSARPVDPVVTLVIHAKPVDLVSKALSIIQL